jgi:thymidylate synthase (FAD)
MTRPRSPSLAPLIGVPLDVLDNGTGYIRVVDYMGSDASIARAARVSYGRQDADRGAEADGKLIRYLMRHRHTSPFEMARLVLHVRLPIFVARQWMRHRTWSFNEVSARYTTLPDDVYVPDLADICGPPTDNKQGRGRALPTGEASEAWEAMITAADHATRAVALLTVGAPADPDAGPAAFGLPAVAPEIARMVGPVCQYTEMTASADLHNLLHFLALRMDSHAQLEIRRYAEAIARIVEQWVPETWQAFRDYRLEGHSMSRMEIEAIRRMMSGRPTTAEDVGMSAREWRDFRAMFGGAA